MQGAQTLTQKAAGSRGSPLTSHQHPGGAWTPWGWGRTLGVSEAVTAEVRLLDGPATCGQTAPRQTTRESCVPGSGQEPDTGLLPQCGSHLAKEAKKDICPWDKDLKGNKPARTSRLEQVPGPGALTD